MQEKIGDKKIRLSSWHFRAKNAPKSPKSHKYAKTSLIKGGRGDLP
jgi:hypothetical protein